MICENCKSEFEGKYSKLSSGRFCSLKCARGFSTKLKRLEINKKVSETVNKKYIEIRSKKPKKCIVCGKAFYGKTKCCGKDCVTNSRRKNFEQYAVRGYNEKAGARYVGWYNEIYCNSSWELAYILYCEEKGLKPVRCKEFFEYEFEGKKYKYYPDFILDGVYIEIKGIVRAKDIAKWRYFPKTLIVHGEKVLLPIIKYIKKKYGKEFYKLFYEQTSLINIPKTLLK